MSRHNHLEGQSSPYLLQHLDNPVDWYPWCEQALALARDTDRPIILSIGYSACHWCHVMAHESFEDPKTARLMNEAFVNIKVDREERPDLDNVYQLAHHLMNQTPGGWPLTVFLSPDDLRPFFSGTYFPPEPRHGLPGFRDVLGRIAAVWRDRRNAIREQGRSLGRILDELAQVQTHTGTLDAAPLTRARDQLQSAFDPRDGGFGAAPKFPHADQLEFLLDYARRHGDPQARHLAVVTLERMARGGILDQLGGGFYRYSVDAKWAIPHFEKMLYDNAALLAVYATASREVEQPLFAETARRTAHWALSEMRSSDGAFWSSLDADSQGVEGRFYVWDREEIRRLLTPACFAAAEAAWGLDRPPNFENRDWHLSRAREDAEIARELGVGPDTVRQRLTTARDRLLEARERRVRPGLDDKILTSWNALMIRGLAVAGRGLAEPGYVDAAGAALAFLHNTAWRRGRLLASSKNDPPLNAYLDDYAFLLDAILELLQARWDDEAFTFATALAEVLLAHFADSHNGGFFFTAHDHETLIQRPRPFADEATPSGNGVAALALQRLGHLTGEPRYLDAAAATLRVAWGDVERAPAGHTTLLRALAEHLDPPTLVIVRGSQAELRSWSDALRAQADPADLSFLIPDSAVLRGGVLEACRARPGGVAYVCRGTRCSAPLESPAQLNEALPVR